MIKLNEIEEKCFEIEVKEGEVKRYDIIDLIKSLSSVLNIASGEIDTQELLDNIDKIKEIFDIEGLSSSQAVSLVEHAMIFFHEEFHEIEEVIEDDIKKKDLEESQISVDSTDSVETKPVD